ncbi:ATP-binding protein [Paenibacillus hodogayensis]|uniref:ATP-binding protein n=1 Tax=Paenibacillus hodogayensis TaxID=279208 RepID=A0ABV5W5F9_9BACL
MRTSPEEAYERVWDYYADELRLLDWRLRQLFVRRRQLANDPQADALRSMYVSEDEFLRMVGEADETEEWDADVDMELAHAGEEILRLEEHIAARKRASALRNAFLPTVYAASVFALDELEQRLILLGLAVELDRKYERIFGFLTDDLTVRLPTVSLALQLTCRSPEELRAGRLAFAADGKLARYWLAREDSEPYGRTLLSRPLALDRRMVAFLLDTGELDAGLQPGLTIHYPDEPLAPLLVHRDAQEQLAGFGSVLEARRSPGAAAIGLHVHGPAGVGKRLQVRHACARWGKNVLIADLNVYVAAPERFGALLLRTIREALLHQAVLAFAHTEALYPDEPDTAAKERLRIFQAELDRFPLPVLLLSEPNVRLEWSPAGRVWLDRALAVPGDSERLELWKAFAADAGLEADEAWNGLAVKFRFTPGQIRDALNDAALLAAWERKDAQAMLYRACYRQMRHRLDRKAVRIEPRYAWDDIVLPDEQKELLRSACGQIRHRAQVYGDWGFDKKLAYGKGLSMLFAGPPGTGKTMSAQVVANDLGMELYKIDLSQVISKYIGETEKNLHEIFGEAQKSGAILFFDETDALFGKRSEVKDAHDKYANIETAYLLQKMEEYDGISVLATNLLNNIDEAFLRRINYVIKFPFPDAEYREKLWRAAFPRDLPLSADIDFRWLGQKFEMAGGNIKNVTLSAAFLAAENGSEVGMREIVKAVRHELQKSGKILPRNELEGY